ncbi:MAG: hypothetical protein ACTHMS_13270 [Jatrophihabitans sp.]|uniref:hypothetical protein n=1 Tax=Jatrophihabitans sp. TaxID=1932789 RepID=UPI003F811F75
MSSATVRAALAAYLEAAQIPGLNKVHPGPPYWADGSEWNLAATPGGGAGAIAALHIIEESERRLTVPAVSINAPSFGGAKMVTYKVGLMVFYQWLLPSNQLEPVEESAWTDPLDAIIDGIKARLRADPNCGTGSPTGTPPPTIWESAQEPGDLKVQRDLPRRLNGKVLSWNVIEWTVIEMIQPD